MNIRDAQAQLEAERLISAHVITRQPKGKEVIMKGYHDRHGVELNAGDYIRFTENGKPMMLYQWKNEDGEIGLGTDATNPKWIGSGRAEPCEYGIYPLDNSDMETCELCGEN
jgi:hypothetical protein